MVKFKSYLHFNFISLFQLRHKKYFLILRRSIHDKVVKLTGRRSAAVILSIVQIFSSWE